MLFYHNAINLYKSSFAVLQNKFNNNIDAKAWRNLNFVNKPFTYLVH